MANVLSTEMNTLFSQDSDPVMVTKWGGRIRTMQATADISSAASGDVVFMCRLPQGAAILPGSKIVGTDTVTCSVGGAPVQTPLGTGSPNTAAKYKASAALTANTFADLSVPGSMGTPIANKNGEDVTVTLGSAGAGSITLYLQYVVD